MKRSANLVTAVLAATIGVASIPAFAQTYRSHPLGYNNDGTLNVFGAHIEPHAASGNGAGSAAAAAEDFATGSVGRRCTGLPTGLGTAR